MATRNSESPIDAVPPHLKCFPDRRSLNRVLKPLLNKGARNGVRIVARQRNLYASTFPSEVLTCRYHDGHELRLLCKYEVNQEENIFGHRGSVSYEAEVYRKILRDAPCPVPDYYGTHLDDGSRNTWLFLSYLEHSHRVYETVDTADAMRRAAQWLGLFHAANEALASSEAASFLITYTPEYYSRWAQRTCQFAAELSHTFTWL